MSSKRLNSTTKWEALYVKGIQALNVPRTRILTNNCTRTFLSLSHQIVFCSQEEVQAHNRRLADTAQAILSERLSPLITPARYEKPIEAPFIRTFPLPPLFDPPYLSTSEHSLDSAQVHCTRTVLYSVYCTVRRWLRQDTTTSTGIRALLRE